jgi:hypothetical protein
MSANTAITMARPNQIMQPMSMAEFMTMCQVLTKSDLVPRAADPKRAETFEYWEAEQNDKDAS